MKVKVERRENGRRRAATGGRAVRPCAWAENIVTKFAKGQKIFVKGQLKQREYEKDGQKRTVFEVNVFEAAEPINRFSDVDGAQKQQAWQTGQPQQSFQSSEAPF